MPRDQVESYIDELIAKVGLRADAKGKLDQGSANLTDSIWLYGGSKEAIVESIRTGRGGVMPLWTGRLDAPTLKSLAVYVHSLGGGK